MEEFYATAVDTDYLIYNGTIDGQVSSIADLESKSDLFAEFKAVKDGNVWYTGKNLYQARYSWRTDRGHSSYADGWRCESDDIS